MENTMTHLLRLEFRKFNLKRNILITIFLYLFCLLFLTVSMVDSMTDPEQTRDSFMSMFQVTEILLPLLFLVYASVQTSSFVIGEYNNRTIMILFTCPLNKKRLIAAKLMIIILFTAAAMALGYLCCCGWLVGADAAFDMLEDTFLPSFPALWLISAGSSILTCAIISALVVFFLRQLMLTRDSVMHESIGQIAMAAAVTAIATYVTFQKKVAILQ